MKKLLLFTSILLYSASLSAQQNEWQPLFNGKDLSGWDTFLGSPSGKGEKVGLNNNTQTVFTVEQQTTKAVIQVSGECFGVMATQQEYQNYHVKVDFKWGEKKWPPRLDMPRDAGLIYHGFGELGGVQNWIASQECQIQEGDAGDYWPIGDVTIDIPAVLTDTSKYWTYLENAPLRTQTFSNNMVERRVLKRPDNEKPHGEWNTAEVITWGDSSIHIINGKVVMRLYNSRRIVDGKSIPLTKGKIALQSEGAELFYRDPQIKSLKTKPAAFR